MGCIYRSPNSTSENNDQLCQLINRASNRGNSHVVILGDFNYPEVDWESWTSNKANVSHPSWKLINCLQDNFLYQLVDFNTRHRQGQKPSLLDLVITNDDTMVDEIKSLGPLGKSDHVIFFFDMFCYIESDDDTTDGKFLYNKGDYDKLRNDLSSIDWEDEMKNLDANKSWELFANTMYEAMENNIPKTKTRQNEPERRHKPLWMNKDAMRKVKKKYHAWKRYTKTNQYGDYETYCRARNAATNEVRRAKRTYERKLAEEIKVNPKSFWKYVRSKTKVKKGISDLKRKDGSVAYSDEDKAEELNSFFASVFTREDSANVPEPETKYHGDKLVTVTVTTEEVLKKLKKLNPSKSPGPDGMHPRVLKEVAEEISSPLTDIFNTINPLQKEHYQRTRR